MEEVGGEGKVSVVVLSPDQEKKIFSSASEKSPGFVALSSPVHDELHIQLEVVVRGSGVDKTDE